MRTHSWCNNDNSGYGSNDCDNRWWWKWRYDNDDADDNAKFFWYTALAFGHCCSSRHYYARRQWSNAVSATIVDNDDDNGDDRVDQIECIDFKGYSIFSYLSLLVF